MVALAGEARKVLWQTVQIYLQGPEHPKFRKPDAAPTIASYDQKIDEEFFNCLFEAPKIGSDEVIHPLAAIAPGRGVSTRAGRLA